MPASKRYDSVIFDLDGTLVDSAKAILTGLRVALQAVDHPVPDDQVLRDMIGVPLDSTFDAGLGVPTERVADARAAYRDFWIAEGRGLTALMTGARELLATLSEAGCQCAVATAKTTEGAWNTVRRHDLAMVFGERVFGYEPSDGVGKHGVVGRALAATSGRVVFLGDAIGDAEAAHGHGIDFVHCRYGYGDHQRLAQLPHVHAVDTLRDLQAFLLD